MRTPPYNRIEIPMMRGAASPANLECRECGHPRTMVKNSRRSAHMFAMRRRRDCPACGAQYHTIEIPATDVDALNRRLGQLERAVERARTAIAELAKIVRNERDGT